MTQKLTNQQHSALDFSTHISLTANAGSGKTFVLSKRFVEIMLGNDIDLQSIVAITFTDKASGELNKKIASEIEHRLEIETDETVISKLRSIRHQLVFANISTIHSFCTSLLREYAPEAGIDVNFTPIDENVSGDLIQLSIDESLNRLINVEPVSSSIKYLIRIFGSKNNLIKSLIHGTEKRKNLEKLQSSIYTKSEEEIVKHFRHKFENDFKEIIEPKIDAVIPLLVDINKTVLLNNQKCVSAPEIANTLNKYSACENVFEKLTLLKSVKAEMLTEKYLLRKKSYLNKDYDQFIEEEKDVSKLFKEISLFIEIENADKYEVELARFGIEYVRLITEVLRTYNQKKNQKGFVDYEDILILTKKLLANDNVIEELSDKYEYIMIDEYQDTDELQYEIFMPILDYLNKGNLFVVGDEKQSIYMFRDAELEIFDRTRNKITGSSITGRSLELPHSFRMFPNLVLFCNKLFANLLIESNTNFNEIKYSNLICAKNPDSGGSVEILIPNEDDEKQNMLVAKRILNLLSADPELSPKDIAILCRKRKSFKELEESFNHFEIPYSIIGGKGFYQRQSIYDIYNYISFLINDEDDTALIGLLRSPFFNVSDTDLFMISSEQGNSFYIKLIGYSKKQSRFKQICDTLIVNRNFSISLNISSLLRKILLESNYWSVIAARENSKQEIANLEKMISIAADYSSKAFYSLYDFASDLKYSIDENEDEGQAPSAENDDSVKIMTIHQSKGLEYKAVFIYGADQVSMNDKTKSRSITIDKILGIMTKTPIADNYYEQYSHAPIVALHDYITEKKNRAELKRLFYVAVTRAAKYLFISADSIKAKSNSFLQLLIEGLNSELTQQEITISDDVYFYDALAIGTEDSVKNLSLKIPIVSKVENALKIVNSVNQVIKPELYVEVIEDFQKGEIISATKISMFMQCPLKYKLTYEIGFSSVFELVKEVSEDENYDNTETSKIKSIGQLRGKIIHQSLALGRDYNIDKIISAELIENGYDFTVTDIIKDEIYSMLNNFYTSKVYEDISRYQNYFNEFPVYSKEGDHFLFGIIDKVIIEKDKIIIIDYKTDSVPQQRLDKHINNYLPQLHFYAYLLLRLYPQIINYELRLIFLNHIDQKIVFQINEKDLSEFRAELNVIIEKIHIKQFNQNKEHCVDCNYSLEGNKCVADI